MHLQKINKKYVNLFSFLQVKTIVTENKIVYKYVQSRAINFDRQGHSLTRSKMFHCKTVVNIITYHHVV
jgi:predicted patatin/cPLA2 family phospholipase